MLYFELDNDLKKRKRIEPRWIKSRSEHSEITTSIIHSNQVKWGNQGETSFLGLCL